MKKKLASLLAMSVFIPSILTGCNDGGDSDNSSSSSESSTYYGAVSEGDFAEFTFDGQNITYTLDGPKYNNLSGSFSVKVLVQKPFYSGNANETPVYLMLSGNVGLANVKEDNSNMFIVGLKKSVDLTEEDVANRKFIYTAVRNDLSVQTISLEILSDKTWKAYDLNGNEIADGSWSLVDGKYIDIQDATGNIISKAVVKPGVNRAGFVVDIRDDIGGFGVGIEQKQLTKEEVVGRYYYYTYDKPYDEDCYGVVDVYYDDATASYKYHAKTVWCDIPQDTGLEETGTLAINSPVDGMGELTDAKGRKGSVFIDTEDGYFLAVKYDSNGQIVQYIIGSNKVE